MGLFWRLPPFLAVPASQLTDAELGLVAVLSSTVDGYLCSFDSTVAELVHVAGLRVRTPVHLQRPQAGARDKADNATGDDAEDEEEDGESENSRAELRCIPNLAFPTLLPEAFLAACACDNPGGARWRSEGPTERVGVNRYRKNTVFCRNSRAYLLPP